MKNLHFEELNNCIHNCKINTTKLSPETRYTSEDANDITYNLVNNRIQDHFVGKCRAKKKLRGHVPNPNSQSLLFLVRESAIYCGKCWIR